MNKDYWITWLEAALIRTAKTFAEGVLACIVVGDSLSDINWSHALSVGAVAAIIAFFTCIKGLPEVQLAATLYDLDNDPYDKEDDFEDLGDEKNDEEGDE